MELDSRPRCRASSPSSIWILQVATSRYQHSRSGISPPRRAITLADGRPVVPFTQGIALTAGNPGKPLQIDHMAFRVSGVRAIAQRLKAAQVKFFNELHDGVYGLTIYVADPDGNKVELFQEGLKLADQA